ncbi:unnamed protein product [Caenorhabditis bovis]|uniref:Uncharacterized protein n=1 Tax=Caenorhabditis bovis TaxID=2654633 RepID=A0A8S1E715_9PELO|nr:unnamed protein product [Caenorhabditis bovis]
MGKEKEETFALSLPRKKGISLSDFYRSATLRPKKRQTAIATINRLSVSSLSSRLAMPPNAQNAPMNNRHSVKAVPMPMVPLSTIEHLNGSSVLLCVPFIFGTLVMDYFRGAQFRDFNISIRTIREAMRSLSGFFFRRRENQDYRRRNMDARISVSRSNRRENADALAILKSELRAHQLIWHDKSYRGRKFKKEMDDILEKSEDDQDETSDASTTISAESLKNCQSRRETQVSVSPFTFKTKTKVGSEKLCNIKASVEKFTGQWNRSKHDSQFTNLPFKVEEQDDIFAEKNADAILKLYEDYAESLKATPMNASFPLNDGNAIKSVSHSVNTDTCDGYKNVALYEEAQPAKMAMNRARRQTRVIVWNDENNQDSEVHTDYVSNLPEVSMAKFELERLRIDHPVGNIYKPLKGFGAAPMKSSTSSSQEAVDALLENIENKRIQYAMPLYNTPKISEKMSQPSPKGRLKHKVHRFKNDEVSSYKLYEIEDNVNSSLVGSNVFPTPKKSEVNPTRESKIFGHANNTEICKSKRFSERRQTQIIAPPGGRVYPIDCKPPLPFKKAPQMSKQQSSAKDARSVNPPSRRQIYENIEYFRQLVVPPDDHQKKASTFTMHAYESVPVDGPISKASRTSQHATQTLPQKPLPPLRTTSLDIYSRRRASSAVFPSTIRENIPISQRTRFSEIPAKVVSTGFQPNRSATPSSKFLERQEAIALQTFSRNPTAVESHSFSTQPATSPSSRFVSTQFGAIRQRFPTPQTSTLSTRYSAIPDAAFSPRFRAELESAPRSRFSSNEDLQQKSRSTSSPARLTSNLRTASLPPRAPSRPCKVILPPKLPSIPRSVNLHTSSPSPSETTLSTNADVFPSSRASASPNHEVRNDINRNSSGALSSFGRAPSGLSDASSDSNNGNRRMNSMSQSTFVTYGTDTASMLNSGRSNATHNVKVNLNEIWL